MPESIANVTMSIQDSDGSIKAETPDRSLGSISLNATGEQLDDIQVNLDRMYLDSPAPSSLLMGNGNDGAGVCNSFHSTSSGSGNVFTGRRFPDVPDAEGFDKLGLLDVEDISEVLGYTDWLCDLPSGLPSNFHEDDRSFLDTGLLNIRYSLLNYVTRAITEEVFAETKRNAPVSARSNLLNESAGSGATFKVIRRSSAGKSQLNSSQELSSDMGSMEETPSPPHLLNPIIGMTATPDRSPRLGSYASGSPNKLNTTIDMSPDRRESRGSPHHILNTTMDLSSDYRNQTESSDESYVEKIRNMPASARSNLLNETAGSGATFKVIRRSSAGRTHLNTTMELPSHYGGGEEDPSSVHQRLNATICLTPNSKLGNFAGSTSPHKFNTTVDMSPHRNPKLGSLAGSTSPSKFNTTIDLSPLGSPHHPLNTTINISPVDPQGSDETARPPSPSVNLNETFVAANGDSPSTEKSRRVTRNLSYVIRREEESPNNNSSPQASANASRCDLNSTFSYEPDAERDGQGTRSSRNTSMEDLNSRVASQIRSLGCSTITRGGRYSDHSPRVVPNLDETRLVARTSSTDTYSVAHSSESPTSSGLSSPMDAQSYDDIQSSSEAVRRSMPNLAVIRNATNIRSNLVFPQAGGGQLRKNHYISDSRLSRLGNGDNRPRLKVHGSESTSTSSSNQGLSTSDSSRTRGGSNTSTPAALNRITSGMNPGAGAPRVYSAIALTNTSRASSMNRPQGSSMGNVRTTGMAAPRYTGGLRPPRPTSTSTNIQQPANSAASRGSTAPGIPVPTFRAQSRIPAPGQFRFSRPTQITSSIRFGGTISKGSSASQKGPVDDWRDGCY